MKYKLRRYNQIQETDSEEKKEKLLEKGFVLEKANGKLVTSLPENTEDLKTKLEEATAYAEARDKEIETLQVENADLKAKLEEGTIAISEKAAKASKATKSNQEG